MLTVSRKFLAPDLSRSALLRCLTRHSVNNLEALLPKDEQAGKKTKTFKDYAPGFIHVDVKYLPQMPDENERKYLFVAIDRASRWVYLDILPDKSADNAQKFLKDMIREFPGKISKILTDNGKEFTDRYCRSDEREPTGNHPFDKICMENGIEHRLIKPRTPKTNGMVERFNGRIADILKTTRFRSSEDLKRTLLNYLYSYNNVIAQRALKGQTPMQTLSQLLDQPNLTGPDN